LQKDIPGDRLRDITGQFVCTIRPEKNEPNCTRLIVGFAALFIMAQEAVYIRIILHELGHAQPATPLQTDNAMADAVINSRIQTKQTKAMDMRFHWL
jgi:hypothetical protein